MLGGELAVLQAQMFDGLPFDPFSLLDDGAGPAEVGVSGRHMVGLALTCTPDWYRSEVESFALMADG